MRISVFNEPLVSIVYAFYLLFSASFLSSLSWRSCILYVGSQYPSPMFCLTPFGLFRFFSLFIFLGTYWLGPRSDFLASKLNWPKAQGGKLQDQLYLIFKQMRNWDLLVLLLAGLDIFSVVCSWLQTWKNLCSPNLLLSLAMTFLYQERFSKNCSSNSSRRRVNVKCQAILRPFQSFLIPKLKITRRCIIIRVIRCWWLGGFTEPAEEVGLPAQWSCSLT